MLQDMHCTVEDFSSLNLTSRWIGNRSIQNLGRLENRGCKHWIGFWNCELLRKWVSSAFFTQQLCSLLWCRWTVVCQKGDTFRLYGEGHGSTILETSVSWILGLVLTRSRFIIASGEKWFGRCTSFETGLATSIYKWATTISILPVCPLCAYWLCGCISSAWSFVLGSNHVSTSLEIVKKGLGANDMNVEARSLAWNLEMVIDDWLRAKDTFESISEIKKWQRQLLEVTHMEKITRFVSESVSNGTQ